tara:strand:+ start:1200 stop:2093 length:894 start_codon:yes stop_codon:yes gene_type:complete
MTIKHIVISGGGPTGFITYGAVRYLSKEKFWDLKNIETIYGSSIGALMGVVFSLGYDWEWLDDYFIKRPWDKVINITAKEILDSYSSKGIVNETFMIKCMEPLLTAKNLCTNITLMELYNINKIEIHLYSTNLNSSILEKIDISYKTHPDLSVLKALSMSTAYPFVFQPIFEGNDCYVDGGILNNLPLNDCIKQTNCNKDEILVIKNYWIRNNYTLTKESTIFDYLLALLKKMSRTLDTETHQEEVKNTVHCLVNNLDGLPRWLEALCNEELRIELVEHGNNQAKIFLEYLKSQRSI